MTRRANIFEWIAKDIVWVEHVVFNGIYKLANVRKVDIQCNRNGSKIIAKQSLPID